MFTFLEVVLVILLSLLIYQDFKDKLISVWLIAGVLLCNTILLFTNGTLNEKLWYASINALFFIFLLLILTIYYSIKNKKITLLTDQYLGWGDIFFIFTLTLSFSAINFIFYLVFSFIFSLLFYLLMKLFLPSLKKEIPLVGFLAFILILLYIYKWISCDSPFYNESWPAIFYH
jgi:hypothetical protein